MRIIYGDMWKTQGNWFGVPTNTQLNSQGHAIMGKGIALQAKTMYPVLPVLLGQCLKKYGNHVYMFIVGGRNIFTFPTKSTWADQSSLEIIEQSAQELATIARALNTATFVLPRPGCGAGGLKWEWVMPYMYPLDKLDNVHVIDREEQKES